MASPERIRCSAEKVIEGVQAGKSMVVVVSAMSGETDRLLALTKEMVPHSVPREQAALVTTGEQTAVALMAMYLVHRGYEALSLTASQIPIRAENDYLSARIEAIPTEALMTWIKAGKIPVITGFQGLNQDNEVVMLGRGGSDTTAVAIAAALVAKECQIYTDVDGVYTADPRIVPEAKRLEIITMDEMLELASMGAKVLQRRSVEIATKYKVNLRVRSSMVSGPGTYIAIEDNRMERPLISSIAAHRNEARITVHGLRAGADILPAVLDCLAKAGIDLDMLTYHTRQGETVDMSFTLGREHYLKAFNALEELKSQYEIKDIAGEQKLAKLALVGVGLRSHPAVLAEVTQLLKSAGIAILGLGFSELKISLLVDEKHLETALRTLHEGLKLS